MNDELKQRQILQAQHLAAGYAERRERRERIATAALQGQLANERRKAFDENVEDAVRYADALIAKLDKVQP